MSATAAVNGNGRRAPRPRVLTEPVSDGPQSLDAALLAFQAKAPKLQRDATGQIQNRTYGYVTLDGLLDAILALLTELELLWKSWPTTDEHGQPAMRYRMTHLPSGDYDEDVVSLPCVRPDPQAFGSALTYMRRYTLQAYLNLAPGEDDDGAAARAAASVFTGQAAVDKYASASQAVGTHGAAASQAVGTSPSPQPVARPAAPSDRPASVKQRKMVEARAHDADLTAAEFANVILAAAGDEQRTWNEEGAAERTLKRLVDRLPAKLVDAVLVGIAAKA
jgi:ERF superfamily